MTELREEVVRIGEVELSLLRPVQPESLIDEDAFERDEFLPYWAELWPAATALAAALPAHLGGVRAVELGCGLGLPALVAAARGADVTATDWAPDAIDLLRENAVRNRLHVRTEVRDWRDDWDERFDLALAADLFYEHRNVEPLLSLLPRLAPEALLGLAGRPYEARFLRQAGAVEHVAERVVRLRR